MPIRASIAMLALSGLLSACASVEADPTTSRIYALGATETIEAERDVQILCVRERVIGRIIPVRICRPRYAWRRAEESGRELGAQIERGTMIAPNDRALPGSRGGGP